LWNDPGPVDVLRIDQLLDAIAAREPAPGGGSTAALVGAMAAALCAKVARFSEDPGAVAQADALRRRLEALAAEDAEAFVAALSELRTSSGDFDLGRALERAADVPLRIAEACGDVAALAVDLAERGKPALEADARAAAALAAGAARVGALLVEVNLGTAPDDDRVQQANRLAAAAGEEAGA
jgi:methenyltetrahydrofolate cyclohydrolase